MSVERFLRKISVLKRLVLGALVLLLPLSVVVPTTVWILRHQEEIARILVDDGVNVLGQLSSLEYDLQHALSEQVLRPGSRSLAAIHSTVQAIDRAFREVHHKLPDDAPVRRDLLDARKAWAAARTAVQRVHGHSQARDASLPQSSSKTARRDLSDAVQDVEDAREQLSTAIRTHERTLRSAQVRQLHALLWGWGGSLALALAIAAVIAWSIVRPLRAIGAATRRLTRGESNVTVETDGQDELSEVGELFNAMASHFAVHYHRLQTAASTDALTGIPNRRSILEILEAELQVTKIEAQPVGVLMIDVDDFKAINDRHGHAAGDRALCWLAATMRSILRDGDFLGRLAGDEFLIVLPGATAEQAQWVRERLCATVSAERAGDERRPGISAGVASAPGDGVAADELLEQADLALYRDKANRKQNTR